MRLFPFLSLGDVGGDFVTDLAELSADKVYSLRSVRAFLLLAIQNRFLMLSAQALNAL